MNSNPMTHSSENQWYLRYSYLPVPMERPLLLERMVLEFKTFSEETYAVSKHRIQTQAGKVRRD